MLVNKNISYPLPPYLNIHSLNVLTEAVVLKCESVRSNQVGAHY